MSEEEQPWPPYALLLKPIRAFERDIFVQQ